jgi:hypothetical protein
MPRDRFLRAVVFLAVLIGTVRIPGLAGPLPESPDTPAFREFTQRVQGYLKLRKAVPRLRTTKHREEIVERRSALAQAIRESRAGAKQGDIFTPEISEQFLRVIRSTFQGPKASSVRRTIRQGEPLASMPLTINGAYPERLPLTTVPPTLLVRLPELPERLAYRIVGHDFVLEDTEARMIVDFIPGAVP